MSIDYTVEWRSGEAPTLEQIRMCLEDYTYGLAKVEWDTDRFFVVMPGPVSHPFLRMSWITDNAQGAWQEERAENLERVFEVWIGKDLPDLPPFLLSVITRRADEITNNIARGFAVLMARGWKGTYVAP